jgi:protease-4
MSKKNVLFVNSFGIIFSCFFSTLWLFVNLFRISGFVFRIYEELWIMHYLRRTRIMGRIWRRIKQIFRIIGTAFSIFTIGVFLFSVIFMVWIYRELYREPEVQPETLLVMNMKGLILDGPSINPAAQRLLGEDVQTRRGISNNIRKATQDSRIIGILLNMKGYAMNLTTALEIREELIKFKQTGKKLFAYMNSSGMMTYLLVSPADKIYMPPSGSMFVTGFRAEVPFFKNMFDKIGITPEFVYIGKYKTAPQVFTMEHLSDEYREVLNDLLDAYYTDYVKKIADVRNVSVDQVKTWIDDGLYTASEALKAGMIDELLYESQLEQKLKVELGLGKEMETKPETQAETDQKQDEEEQPELNKLNNSQYARVKVDAPGLHNKGEKIAVVYAQGDIVSGKSAPASSGAPSIGAETMTELLASLAKNKEIKGIILRIDSGGGGAQASDIIRNSVQEATQKKPVVVSMADAAASGGYMISAPADSIVAYPLTITGSIGIFGGKFSLEGLYDLIGINIESVQRGKNAGLFTSARMHTEEEQERFRQNIQEGYDKFIENVAQGRKMTLEAVDEIAQGRVWTGTKAAEIGLVDTLGGMETAIAVMKKKIGIPENEDVQLIDYPQLQNPFGLLIRRFRETYVDVKFPDEFLKLRAQLEELARLQDEHLFAWWPCRIVCE